MTDYKITPQIMITKEMIVFPRVLLFRHLLWLGTRHRRMSHIYCLALENSCVSFLTQSWLFLPNLDTRESFSSTEGYIKSPVNVIPVSIWLTGRPVPEDWWKTTHRQSDLRKAKQILVIMWSSDEGQKQCLCPSFVFSFTPLTIQEGHVRYSWQRAGIQCLTKHHN